MLGCVKKPKTCCAAHDFFSNWPPWYGSITVSVQPVLNLSTARRVHRKQVNTSWTQLCSDFSQQLPPPPPCRKWQKKQDILINDNNNNKKAPSRQLGAEVPIHPIHAWRLQTWLKSAVHLPGHHALAWLRRAFRGTCLKHWTIQPVLPLLAPLESWSFCSARFLAAYSTFCSPVQLPSKALCCYWLAKTWSVRKSVCPPGYQWHHSSEKAAFASSSPYR